MIIPLSTAKNNALKIKKILLKHSDKQVIDIILRNYVAYQGNAGYSGEFMGLIKELAKQACENKQKEISKIIRDGIFEILDGDYGLISEIEVD